MNSDADTMPRAWKRIGLLHHLGGGNLGDDASLEAVKQNITRRLPSVEILGFTMNPDDTLRRHGIAAYPIRRQNWTIGSQAATSRVTVKANVKTLLRKWRYVFGLFRAIYAIGRLPITFIQESRFLAQSFRRLRSLDVLIVSGGGQLLDWGGPWKYPYTVFKWAVLVRLVHARCVFLNVGAGPLTHPLSRFFVRGALSCSDYVSFRDEGSRAFARSIGWTRNAYVFPDCVYGLEFPFHDTAKTEKSGRPAVGIAPMPFSDPRSVYPEKNQLVYDKFIAALSSFGSWLMGDYALALLCTDIGVDPPAIADVRIGLGGHETAFSTRPIDIPSIGTIEELLRAMSSLDYLVTCRFHGIVLAHLLNIPVLAISHHPKMDSLMDELGLAEYCVSIRTVDSDLLRRTFLSMVRNRGGIKSRLAERLSVYRNRLSTQFDELVNDPGNRFLPGHAAMRQARPLRVRPFRHGREVHG
jgi:polysaccharide pyruvyl transferase WcaK-like protein